MIWKTSKLSEISKIGDGAHASLKRIESGIPYLTAKNITKSGIDYTHMDYISEETYNKYFKKESNALTQPRKGDILYSIIGSIGGVYVVKDEKISISSSVAFFRANAEVIISQYLAYFLRSESFDAQVQAIKGGVAQGFMSLEKLGTVTILYPDDINYQKRIANILYTYDSLIENNQKQINLLEEAAQRLYKEWFVDLRFPGYDSANIVDGIPEGWKQDNVGSIVSLLSGYAFRSGEFKDGGKYKIVTIKNVQDGAFEGENVNRLLDIPAKMPEHCRLFEGDILLSLTGNVGRVCLAYGEDYLLNQRVAKLRSNYTAYVYSLFRSKDMFIEMNNLANGAAQQNLSPIRTEKLKILIPSIDLIEEYEKLVKPFIDKILLLNKQNAHIKQARDRLLPKLMNGEIEV